ncbi:MAG: META domain-containing protein [Alistipes sp.]|nr:META domain-containing protein [Alistipes sp.]
MKIKALFGALLCAMILVGCCACRQSQKNAKPLKSTEWHLVQLGGQDVELAINTFNITLAEDGSLSGVGACNRLLGQYTTADNYAITFSPVGTTMMVCPENEALESQFVALLGEITHYDIDGDKLMLLNQGTIKAILQALPVAEK